MVMSGSKASFGQSTSAQVARSTMVSKAITKKKVHRVDTETTRLYSTAGGRIFEIIRLPLNYSTIRPTLVKLGGVAELYLFRVRAKLKIVNALGLSRPSPKA